MPSLLPNSQQRAPPTLPVLLVSVAWMLLTDGTYPEEQAGALQLLLTIPYFSTALSVTAFRVCKAGVIVEDLGPVYTSYSLC